MLIETLACIFWRQVPSSSMNGADAEKAWTAMWKNDGMEIIASDQGIAPLTRMLSLLTQSPF